MPYFISTKSFDVQYPEECPYCSIPNATAKFNQPFSKMEAGMIPGQFKSKTWKVLLPACDSCADIFRKFRIGYFLSGILALVFPICIVALYIFYSTENLQSFAITIWGGFIVTWATLLVLRIMKLKKFKLVYVGNGEVVFSSTNQNYAKEFADLNKVKIEEKRFFVKLS